VVIVLGAGVTGLAVAMASGAPVFEAASGPGGLCSSYYVRPDGSERLVRPPGDDEAYRFELGGGHWIFGGDPQVLARLDALAPSRRYERRAAIDLGGDSPLVPYPIQANLGALDPDLSRRATEELSGGSSTVETRTMREWLLASFGPSLCDSFFFPFHERYTAGLYHSIAPQDADKSPAPAPGAGRGTDRAATIGYNPTFTYPRRGLDALVHAMADACDVQYGHRVVAIDPVAHEVAFDDGSSIGYTDVVSTLPLVDAVRLAGLEVEGDADPHTSVLVLNIGAERGLRHPDEHWIYQPHSTSGHHRIGFYSNVDESFLPGSARRQRDRSAVYVERAYPGGHVPTAAERSAFSDAVVAELQTTGYIGAVDVVDPTWIDVAYTWSWPGSTWRDRAIDALATHGIHQVGRFARWSFQGIADSVQEGLQAGTARRAA
jgi:protoporphyrinogen oxidase